MLPLHLVFHSRYKLVFVFFVIGFSDVSDTIALPVDHWSRLRLRLPRYEPAPSAELIGLECGCKGAKGKRTIA